MELKISIDDKGLRRKLALIASAETARAMNRQIGVEMVERVKDFLDEMSVSRHKTADRLGARHTKYLAGASGRSAGRPGQGTFLESADEREAVISIKNTPGLARAFHDLDIVPVRASALTIPIHRIAYGKRVKDLRAMGHNIFRPGKSRILAEQRGKGRLRPLYALVKRVHIPQDEGLLPSRDKLREWATESVENFMEATDALG